MGPPTLRVTLFVQKGEVEKPHVIAFAQEVADEAKTKLFGGVDQRESVARGMAPRSRDRVGSAVARMRRRVGPPGRQKELGMSRVCLNFNRTWDEVGNIVTNRDAGGKPIGWVKDAFKGGVADKVLLPKGTRLYKFNNSPVLVDMSWLAKDGVTLEAAVTISPWWSPYNSYFHKWSAVSGRGGSTTHDPGWLAKAAMAKTLGVSVREWGRITSAVKENWNSLKYLMVFTLKHDAYGWFGGFTAMSRIDPNQASKRFGNEGAQSGTQKFTSEGMRNRLETVGSRGSLAGGGTQFYIPNVRVINVASWTIQDLSTM